MIYIIILFIKTYYKFIYTLKISLNYSKIIKIISKNLSFVRIYFSPEEMLPYLSCICSIIYDTHKFAMYHKRNCDMKFSFDFWREKVGGYTTYHNLCFALLSIIRVRFNESTKSKNEFNRINQELLKFNHNI